MITKVKMITGIIDTENPALWQRDVMLAQSKLKRNWLPINSSFSELFHNQV